MEEIFIPLLVTLLIGLAVGLWCWWKKSRRPNYEELDEADGNEGDNGNDNRSEELRDMPTASGNQTQDSEVRYVIGFQGNYSF